MKKLDVFEKLEQKHQVTMLLLVLSTAFLLSAGTKESDLLIQWHNRSEKDSWEDEYIFLLILFVCPSWLS